MVMWKILQKSSSAICNIILIVISFSFLAVMTIGTILLVAPLSNASRPKYGACRCSFYRRILCFVTGLATVDTLLSLVLVWQNRHGNPIQLGWFGD